MSEAPIDLQAIRRALGGRVWDGGRRWSGPGPGHSRKDASLSVRLTDDGKVLTHSFAGDAFTACADHLGLERGRRSTRPADLARQAAASRARHAQAMARAVQVQAFCTGLWAGREPIGGSPAEAYLQGRGLPGPFADDLAYHPAAPLAYEGATTRPALIALARDGAGRPSGLHVTALALPADPHGPVTKATAKGKAGARRMFGPMAGCAVRLAPLAPDGGLAVAEGLETALSFMELFARPCWAALSAPGLATLQLPQGLTRLTIAADGDDPGLTAARALAQRARRHMDVEICAAPDGQDWNDRLRETLR